MAGPSRVTGRGLPLAVPRRAVAAGQIMNLAISSMTSGAVGVAA
ncbi:hypothetical protein RKE29_04495 [Streptomyces sp. B1866]|nr:hypothetical protein [Streptomyces sp. B1866]